MIAGRYALETEIGRGGMGTVWLGRDEVLGRRVALKKIGVALAGGLTPDVVRAQREAQLAAKLNHANVVAVFDLVSDGEDQWLVMEYVEGTNLSEIIRTRGRLEPDEVAPILAQTANALAAAHGAGIVHRDVKPSNILVTPSGQVKLSDFGIARTTADPALTQTGLVTGSPAYLSPEVASGQQATATSDVWSWGATLFHALEGRPPYQMGDNLLGALYRIVHEEPPRPAAAGWLAPVLQNTMTRDPAQRWSIARVQDFLEAGPGLSIFPAPTPVSGRRRRTAAVASTPDPGTQVLPLPPVAATPPPPTPVRPLPAVAPQDGGPQRRPWLLGVAAAVVLAVVMVVAFWLGLGGNDDGDDDQTAPDDTSTSASGTPETSPSASPSEDAGLPTPEAMTSFVSTYIDTVVSDPEAAYEMLTPEFQEQSNGIEGYVDFWGDVRSAKIERIDADPESLQVVYRYRYQKGGGPPVDDDVTLQLAYADGQFLIAGEA